MYLTPFSVQWRVNALAAGAFLPASTPHEARNVNKKLIALSVTLALASGLAVAQSVAPAAAPSATPDRAARQAEHEARAQARFAETDRNKDGRISLAEFQDASDRKLAERFARLDANKDGQLTQAEMQQARGEGRERMEGRRGAMHGGMDKMRALDTNHDEALTRAEIGTQMPKLAERFDMLDANHDGRLTHDEMRAGRGSWQGDRAAH